VHEIINSIVENIDCYYKYQNLKNSSFQRKPRWNWLYYKPSHNLNVERCLRESWRVSRWFAVLRQLRHLCRYVTDDCFRWVLMSLIHSRLDFGNFALVGLLVCLQPQLQSVLNAAAGLVLRLRRYDHITDDLAAYSTTGRLESCGHGVSSTEWSVSVDRHILISNSSCCWSVWSSSSALILITPVAGCGILCSYRRPAFISSCYTRPLEQLASWYSVIRLSGRFMPQTKDIRVPPVISRHFAVTIHISTSLSWTL